MEYVRAVFLEAVRLRSPAPFMVHVIKKELVAGKYTLPEGSLFASCLRLASCNERFFSNPKTFLPERWIDSERSKMGKEFIHNPALGAFGFGSGRRNHVHHFADDLFAQDLAAASERILL